jgi:hypothetical protein
MPRILPAFALLALLSIPAHAQCGNPVISPIVGNYSICGQILKQTSAGWTISANYYIKLCPVTGFGQCRTGRAGVCDTTYPYTCYGYRYNFPGFLTNADSNAWHNVYLWSDNDQWGSDQTPVARIPIGDASFGSNDIFYALPRPLPPAGIYPSNNVRADSAFTLEWDSGMTPDRMLPKATVTYDVWYKYWYWDASEPANYTLAAAGMPCNPLPNGHCSTTESNMPDGSYRWYVKAHLDVSNNVPVELQPAIMSADSSQTPSSFVIGFNGRLPGCCR